MDALPRPLRGAFCCAGAGADAHAVRGAVACAVRGAELRSDRQADVCAFHFAVLAAVQCSNIFSDLRADHGVAAANVAAVDGAALRAADVTAIRASVDAALAAADGDAELCAIADPDAAADDVLADAGRPCRRRADARALGGARCRSYAGQAFL